MKVLNHLLMGATDVAMAQNTDEQDLRDMIYVDVLAQVTGNNPAVKTFISGTADVQTMTFPAKAGAADGDNIIFYDQAGGAWGISLDTTGGAANLPNYAAWTALDPANVANVDISGATTAASVAALVETAVDALTGFTALIVTDDSAANGTMTFTQTVPGIVLAAVPKNKTGAAAGTITVASTTPGVDSTVNPTANTVTVAAHGYLTGVKVALTTGGVLPAGLSATNYYMIVVDANTLKFATSQANALAGTAVDITDYGTGTHTLTPAATLGGSVKLQKNSQPETETPVWVDLTNGECLNGSASQSFSGAANLSWALAHVGFRGLRAVFAVTTGTVSCTLRVGGKGV